MQGDPDGWSVPGRYTRAERYKEIGRMLQTPEFQAARVKFIEGRMIRINNRQPSPTPSPSPRAVRRKRQRDLEYDDEEVVKKREEQEENNEQLRLKIDAELKKIEYLQSVSVHPRMLMMRSGEEFDEGSVRVVHELLTSLCRTRVGEGPHDFMGRMLQHDYYIGICCSPKARWTGEGGRGCHQKDGWDKMVLLAAGDAPFVGKLEDVLIKKEHGNHGCTNKAKFGGQRCAPESTQSFLYLCVSLELE